MSARLDAALAELADAIREEVRSELGAERPSTDVPRMFSVAQAAEQLGLSRAFCYRELVATGQLASRKIGGRRLVSDTAIRDFVDRGGE